jgi:hypothetical protein
MNTTRRPPAIAMRTAAVLSDTTMRCIRVYATPDGKSHFDEIDIPTTERPVFPDTAPFELSAHYPASRIRFTCIPAAMHEVGYHTVPERVSRHSANGQTVIWITLPNGLDLPSG